jgi:phospholipid/cholesterol/gamma-HCH transport system substrate-binding protein
MHVNGGTMHRTIGSFAMQVKVGLFVSLGLVLLAVAIVYLGRHGTFLTPTIPMALTLPRADGLRVGAPVRLAGIEIGVVKGLALTPEPEAARVRVDLALQAAVAPHLKADATAVIRSQGLLGEKYVDILPGHATQTWQDTPHPLGGTPSLQPEEVFAQLATTVETLQALLKGVQDGQGVVGKLASDPHLYDSLVELTAEATKTVQALNHPTGTMGQLLHSQALHAQLTRVVQGVEALVQRAGSPQSTVGKLLRGSALYDHSTTLMGEMTNATRQVSALLAKLNGQGGTAGQLLSDGQLYQESRAAVQRLTAVSQRLERVLAQLDNGVGTAGRLLTDPTLYRNLNDLIRNVNQLVQDFQRNPQRYVTVKIF